jgi:hypothetical protein
MSRNGLKLIAVICAVAIMSSMIVITEQPIAKITTKGLKHYNPADLMFSYDFDDENLSDWYSFAIDDGIPYNVYPSNISVVNGSMKMQGDHWNIALVNSSVAYGSWSFDVFVEDVPVDHEIVIPFILIEYVTDLYLMQAYFFQIVTGNYHNFLIPGTNPEQPRLQAGKMYRSSSHEGRSLEWKAQKDTDDIWGWKNFIITREDNGQFYAYMNGSLLFGFKDVQHTTCNYFGFSTRAGVALDNLFVYDNVIYDAAPPEWSPTPTDQVVELGQDFRYDINATDFSGLGTWTVNDTTNFAIDSNGVVTNVLDLTVGTYGLNVSVSDTGGFTRSAVFKVLVESSTPTPPDLIMYVAVGGGALVVIALVVVFMKKRG